MANDSLRADSEPDLPRQLEELVEVGIDFAVMPVVAVVAAAVVVGVD